VTVTIEQILSRCGGGNFKTEELAKKGGLFIAKEAWVYLHLYREEKVGHLQEFIDQDT